MNQPSTSSHAAWERKLAAYVVGSAAVLAASNAEADVIYSGVQDIPIGVDQSYGLDLDGDAVVDFTFQNVLDTLPDPDIRQLLVAPAGTNAVTHFASIAFPLPPGVVIPGTQKFTSTPGPLETSVLGTDFWSGHPNEFLGLRFLIGGATHFGWARLTVEDGPDVTAVLHDWAYNDTPREGLETGAVPEPASLALLALGAAGLGAHRARRRRDSQTTA